MRTWQVTLRGKARCAGRPYVLDDTIEVMAQSQEMAVDLARMRCREYGTRGRLELLRVVPAGEEVA